MASKMKWSDVVRGGPAPPKSKLNPNAPLFVPRPPCENCGMPSAVCRHCNKLAVYKDGLCGHCFSYRMPSESMCIGYIHASNHAEQIPFTCSVCTSSSVRMPWEPPRPPSPPPKKQWATCEDCGETQLHVCEHCEKRVVHKFVSPYCDDCDLFESTGCPECDAELDWPCLAEVDPKKEELFLCKDCHKNRDMDKSHIWSYWYWPANRDEPLSPTNVYRIPRYRPVSEGPSDPVARADEAMAAYNEELKFSGDQEEALKIYTSFYQRFSPKKEKPLKEGYVEMNDILKGQRVTAEQFFDAVRCAEAEEDPDDKSIHDPKKMSYTLLNRALYQVDDDRKMLSRKMRKCGTSPADEAMMDAMNAYAKAVVDEMEHRV
jgi:hypothetical protein